MIAKLKYAFGLRLKRSFTFRSVAGEIELAWSYILDFENAANPFEERRAAIGSWRKRAVIDISETPALLENAKALTALGLHSKDALHVACAVEADCDYFLTTDDAILKKLTSYTKIKVTDPTAFVRSTEP